VCSAPCHASKRSATRRGATAAGPRANRASTLRWVRLEPSDRKKAPELDARNVELIPAHTNYKSPGHVHGSESVRHQDTSRRLTRWREYEPGSRLSTRERVCRYPDFAVFSGKESPVGRPTRRQLDFVEGSLDRLPLPGRRRRDLIRPPRVGQRVRHVETLSRPRQGAQKRAAATIDAQEWLVLVAHHEVVLHQRVNGDPTEGGRSHHASAAFLS